MHTWIFINIDENSVKRKYDLRWRGRPLPCLLFFPIIYPYHNASLFFSSPLSLLFFFYFTLRTSLFSRVIGYRNDRVLNDLGYNNPMRSRPVLGFQLYSKAAMQDSSASSPLISIIFNAKHKQYRRMRENILNIENRKLLDVGSVRWMSLRFGNH